MNTLGHIFRLTTFGESHGPAMGGIIDGCPSGIPIDTAFIQQTLLRRQGDSAYTTARKEPDEVEYLSGLYQGATIGTPLAFIIRNHEQKSADYDRLSGLYRPGHGDLGLHQKYPNYDPRGGGRSSARETVSWVVAGSIAKQILHHLYGSIEIQASVESIGGRKDLTAELLAQAQSEGDTLGGVVQCIVSGDPQVLALAGSPVFDKLNASLAHAMMSIPSAIGFEMGAGFSTASMRGSEYTDQFIPTGARPLGTTATNHCGGIQAGLSNGMPIQFRVAFHPIVTLPRGIDCIDDHGQLTHIQPQGRHDLCQVLRTPVIVESLAAIVLLDHKLQDNHI